ncbi:MAG: NAD(+)/NADH kinase [archaeon]
MKLSCVLLVYAKPGSRIQKSALDSVIQTLKGFGISFDAKERDGVVDPDFRGRDLIISFGGDGTYLRCSHHILDRTPVLGINPDPSTKEGFFTRATAGDFEGKLGRILNNDFKEIALNRLETKMGKKLPCLALNDIYIGHKAPYCTFRYKLKVGMDQENQKSSGIIAAAPAGSHAWLNSAGGKKQPLSSEQFQFIVREVYEGRLTASSIKKGMLSRDQALEVTSHIDHGIVVIDSIGEEHPLKAAQTVRVGLSDKPLIMIDIG